MEAMVAVLVAIYVANRDIFHVIGKEGPVVEATVVARKMYEKS